jgi:hypothetical protein
MQAFGREIGRKQPRNGLGVFGRIIRCVMGTGWRGGVRNQFGWLIIHDTVNTVMGIRVSYKAGGFLIY